ncbi:MAG TPA: 6-phosphogluconolactonase, partial [Anaeromyxobacter sp.]
MELEVLPDAEAVARRGADVVAAEARAAVRARGLFLLAVSGGATPRRMFHLLAGADVPWANVHLFQADERVAPPGHRERNLTQLAESLLARAPIPAAQV